MSKVRLGVSMWLPVGTLLFACGGPAPEPSQEGVAVQAESAEQAVVETKGSGTLVIKVVGDAVSGTVGDLPPDTLETTPLANVSVYDGTYEKGTLLGETDSTGSLSVTIALGAHKIGVVELSKGKKVLFGSNNHSVKVTTSSKLTVHVAPTKVKIVTDYNVGYGNAIYVSGESRYLGDWQTAYKATYDASAYTWSFEDNLPIGAQFKLIEAPWVSGDSIPVSTAGLLWDQGANVTITAPTKGHASVVTVEPTF